MDLWLTISMVYTSMHAYSFIVYFYCHSHAAVGESLYSKNTTGFSSTNITHPTNPPTMDFQQKQRKDLTD